MSTRPALTPMACAAVTKSRWASDSTSARTTRAVSIHPATPTSTISSGIDGCRTAATIMSSGSRGTASIASVRRISSCVDPAARDIRRRRRRRRRTRPLTSADSEPDGERDARTEQDAREDVASEFVGAEPVRHRRAARRAGAVQVSIASHASSGASTRQRDDARTTSAARAPVGARATRWRVAMRRHCVSRSHPRVEPNDSHVGHEIQHDRRRSTHTMRKAISTV